MVPTLKIYIVYTQLYKNKGYGLKFYKEINAIRSPMTQISEYLMYNYNTFTIGGKRRLFKFVHANNCTGVLSRKHPQVNIASPSFSHERETVSVKVTRRKIRSRIILQTRPGAYVFFFTFMAPKICCSNITHSHD